MNVTQMHFAHVVDNLPLRPELRSPGLEILEGPMGWMIGDAIDGCGDSSALLRSTWSLRVGRRRTDVGFSSWIRARVKGRCNQTQRGYLRNQWEACVL